MIMTLGAELSQYAEGGHGGGPAGGLCWAFEGADSKCGPNGRLGPGRDQKGNICADVFACVLFLSFHSIFRVVF